MLAVSVPASLVAVQVYVPASLYVAVLTISVSPLAESDEYRELDINSSVWFVASENVQVKLGARLPRALHSSRNSWPLRIGVLVPRVMAVFDGGTVVC